MAGTYVQCDKACLLLRSVRVYFDGLARLEFLKGRQPVTGFNCTLARRDHRVCCTHAEKTKSIKISGIQFIHSTLHSLIRPLVNSIQIESSTSKTCIRRYYDQSCFFKRLIEISHGIAVLFPLSHCCSKVSRPHQMNPQTERCSLLLQCHLFSADPGGPQSTSLVIGP